MMTQLYTELARNPTICVLLCLGIAPIIVFIYMLAFGMIRAASRADDQEEAWLEWLKIRGLK